MCVPTRLGRRPTTHQHDFIYYIYVCLSMLTQLSKTCGNIKHNFIHISVGIVGHCPRCVGTHMCTKLYMCKFIFPCVLDGCVGMRTHMYIKSCRCVVGRRLRHMGTHMCMKLYVCEFIFPRVLDSCVHTWCVSVMWLTTYSFIHMCVPTCLGRRPTTHQHDFIYYIHVCLSMLAQPSKMCGNIKHDFIHISVGIVGRHLRRVGTHMCMKLYVCEFIFPRILDGCVSMLGHTCI